MVHKGQVANSMESKADKRCNCSSISRLVDGEKSVIMKRRLGKVCLPVDLCIDAESMKHCVAKFSYQKLIIYSQLLRSPLHCTAV